MATTKLPKGRRWLEVGDTLMLTCTAAGLGVERLDVHILQRGDKVRYLKPARLLVLLPSGEEVEVRTDALIRDTEDKP